MKLSRYFCLIFLAISLSLAASVPAAAKDKWISLHTKSFLIVSNGSSDDTRRLALKLEQFRAIFAKLTKTENSSPVPITLVAFKNDGSFKPFKPLCNGKPANVAGYFQRGEDENMIALDMSSGDEYPLQVIFHEYTH